MKVDYLVVYSNQTELEVRLMESLKELLAVSGEPPSDETIKQSIQIRYTRTREDGQRISGLTIDFDTIGVEEDETDKLISDLSKVISNSLEEGITHVLKLHDPALYLENQRYAKEIFEIEMKLREALSFIFIDTYGAGFYKLLKDIDVKIIEKDVPQEDQMKAHCENEFYFLVFSQYIHLTNPKRPKLEQIIELIGEASDFDHLQRMISGHPIVEEKYIDFLISLKARVEPIEKLRNCVAHNRTISKNTRDEYKMVKEDILASINRFLEEVGNYSSEDLDDT